MPILHRTHRPAAPDAVSTVQLARVSRGWPVSLVLIALIVFALFWTQTTMLIAVVMALAATGFGAFLLTLMFGAAWITRHRRRPAVLPRYR